MTAVDHIFFLIIAVIHPIVGYISFKRLLRRIAAGENISRAKLYNTTLLGHWALFGITLAIWSGTGRPWDVLGFGLTTGGWFLAGALLTVVGIALLLMQVRQVKSADDAELQKYCDQLGQLEVILPRNGNELGRFYGLSFTAGIVEETIWRGFMIWYLAPFLPLWAAAVVSAIGFGAAHAYQGAANLPRITLVGAAFVGLYLLTGSLWLPMIMHAAVDILQGRLAYEVIHRTAGGASANDGTTVEA